MGLRWRKAEFHAGTWDKGGGKDYGNKSALPRPGFDYIFSSGRLVP